MSSSSSSPHQQHRRRKKKKYKNLDDADDNNTQNNTKLQETLSKEKKKKHRKVKIVLVGDTGCGKTSLIYRLKQDTFDQSRRATIGCDYVDYTIELEDKNKNKNKHVKMSIWDTAGQERFRSVCVSYYREANGIIVVFDTTNRKTFENCESWVKDVKKHNLLGAPMLLVGNKQDLDSKRFYENKDDILAKAGKLGVFAFIESSALTSHNVIKIFETIAREVERTKASQGENNDEEDDGDDQNGTAEFDYTTYIKENNLNDKKGNCRC